MDEDELVKKRFICHGIQLWRVIIQRTVERRDVQIPQGLTWIFLRTITIAHIRSPRVSLNRNHFLHLLTSELSADIDKMICIVVFVQPQQQFLGVGGTSPWCSEPNTAVMSFSNIILLKKKRWSFALFYLFTQVFWEGELAQKRWFDKEGICCWS